jgi:hypothetical protein
MRTNGEEGTGAGNQAPPTDFAGSTTGQPIEYQRQAVGAGSREKGTGSRDRLAVSKDRP